jgi:ferritin-like protein
MNENGEAPVTRAELLAELEQFFVRVTERIYDMETKLLRAFREFATAQA